MLSFALKNCQDCDSLENTICSIDGLLAKYGLWSWQDISYLTNHHLSYRKIRHLMYYKEILNNLVWNQCYYNPYNFSNIVSQAQKLTEGEVGIARRAKLPVYTTTTTTSTTSTSTSTTTSTSTSTTSTTSTTTTTTTT